MATYTADAAQSNIQPRFHAGGTTAVRGVYSASVALASGDIIHLIKMPANSRVLHLNLRSNKLADLGNAGFTLGDTGTVDRYVKSAAVLLTTGIVHEGMPNHAGSGVDPSFFYSASATRTIMVTIDRIGVTSTGSAIFVADVVYMEV